jgi:hypothetical protein
MGQACTKTGKDPAVELQANRTESKRKRKEDRSQDMDGKMEGTGTG